MHQRIVHPIGDFELAPGRVQIAIFTTLEAITEGDAVYANTSGNIGRAQADASSTMPAIGVASEGIASGGAGQVVTHGPVRSTNYDSSGFIGREAWVSDAAAGALLNVPPSTSGLLRQQLGVWQEREVLYVTLAGGVL